VSLGHPHGRDRLRVAVDATPLLGVRSGIGMYCDGVLHALGARVDLEVAAYAVTWRRRHRLPPLVPSGVRAVQRPMPARPLHFAWARSSRIPVEWFIGPTDVVHGTNFVVPPTRRAARVVTVHDLTNVRYPAMCDPATLRFAALVRRAVAEGAWVHTLSQFVADEAMAEFGVVPERVRVVRPGIPAHGPAPGQRSRGKRETVLPAGTHRYIIAFGTVEPRKDLPGLVAAFSLMADDHKDVALILAGSPGWGDDALDRAVAASPWRERIVRPGYVPEHEHRALLTGAWVLAYPSVYEGFGFPPLEAMKAGVPVVTTAVGAIPETVGNGARLVPAGDIDALAGALADLVDDEDERRALIARGRARAELFTWEACGQGLDDLYAAAAGGR
jgi:glycosyltransferase involved in cell wall biosynthesis